MMAKANHVVRDSACPLGISSAAKLVEIEAIYAFKVGARQSLPLERFISLIGYAVPLQPHKPPAWLCRDPGEAN